MGVVAHPFNPSTQVAEVDNLCVVSSWLAFSQKQMTKYNIDGRMNPISLYINQKVNFKHTLQKAKNTSWE